MSYANPDPPSADRSLRWTRSIGLRLTLLAAGTTLLVCIAVCVALYMGVYISLNREVDGFLEGEIGEFIAILNEHQNDTEAVQREIRAEMGSRERLDLVFRLLNSDGRVIASSDGSERLRDPWPTVDHVMRSAHKPQFETVELLGERRRARVATLWTGAFSNSSQHIVQVAYVLDRVDYSLARFRELCLLALALAVALAGAAGHAIARRVLRPIDEITITARRISATNVTARLALSGAGDEFDRLAETLNQMLDRIEVHIRRVQQFTADASHELRTPLAALRGSAEVALTGRRNAEQLRTVLEENIEQLDRITSTAEQLLLLARFDSGDAGLRMESLALDELLENIVDLYSPLAGERGVALRVTQREPLRVTADRNRLGQVFSNLIDNAIKYGGRAGLVEARISTGPLGARVEVVDSGPGVNPRDLPRLFDRFYRADPSRAAGGAGLGLAICKSIVEAHGGRIELIARSEGGTRAVVDLPTEAQ